MTPILGVCLGHQCIGAAYGGTVERAKRPMHGKTCLIEHEGTGVFSGLPDPLRVTRYHSLIVAEKDLPADLEITARSDEGEIMALQHAHHPVVGVQFHPEAVLTEHGHALLRNFLALSSPAAG
jgi:anthranilate synthase component 2/para-aminobenzoate synthetase component 2